MAKPEEFEWEIISLDFHGRQIGRSGEFIGTKHKAIATLRATIARELRGGGGPFGTAFYGAYAKKIRPWVRSR